MFFIKSHFVKLATLIDFKIQIIFIIKACYSIFKNKKNNFYWRFGNDLFYKKKKGIQLDSNHITV